MTTERECHPLRRHQIESSCVPPRLPERDRPGTKMGPNRTEGRVSNSAAERSSLHRPKTFVALVEKLEAVDTLRVKDPSVVATEGRDRKTWIRHHGSIGWVVLNR